MKVRPASAAVASIVTSLLVLAGIRGSGAIELVSRVPEPSTESALAIGVLVLAACCRMTILRLRTFKALIARRRFNQFVLPRWRSTNSSPKYVALLMLCWISGDCLAQTGDSFLPGEYRVGYQELAAFDTARDNRPVTTLVWYPADADVTEGAPIHYARPLWGWTQESPFIGGFMDVPVTDAGPFPLLVLSHGHGDLPQEFELLGEVLASHGYVVAAPHHAGNSAVTTDLPGMASHRPADISFVIDTMLARSATPGDLLSNAINVNAVAVGGFSRGAATATATVSGRLATNATEFDVPPDPRVKALVLIDGTPNTVDTLTPELRATVSVPTLSIGGSAGNFPANSNQLRVAGPMYGVDAINAAHGDFVLSCRFLKSLVEDNAPQEVLNFFGVNAPIECGPDLLPSGEVVEIVARHTTAFLDSQLGNDRTNEDTLKTNRQDLAGRITLRASVIGAGTASEWADLILTDPSGRRIGVDPQTGASFSDFTAQEIQYVTGQSSRAFSINTNAVLAGDYLLTAHGNASIVEPRTLLVTLELMEQRQHSRVFERKILLSEGIDAGTAIDPLTFEIVPAVVTESGDFNQDGTVDAADYVVWRKGLGTTYTQADYDVWRANFGRAPSAGWSIGSGGALPSAEPLPIAVPEPVAWVMLLTGTLTIFSRRSNSAPCPVHRASG
jgi:predicted dienelactone hydrolase